MTDMLQSYTDSPQGWSCHGFAIRPDGIVRRYALPPLRPVLHTHPALPSAFDMFRYPTTTQALLARAVPALADVDPALFERVATEGRYYGHVRRQAADVRAFMADEQLVLDPHIDYAAVVGLSAEVRERLAAVRPTSIVSVVLSLRCGTC